MPAMLANGPTVRPGLEWSLCATANSSSELRRQMVALARLASSPLAAAALRADRSTGDGVAEYVERRFARYESLIAARDATGLVAFQLVQRFESAGARYAYLGPLFSRGGAYLPLFAAFSEHLMQQSRASCHLSAEVQNPAVLRVFQTFLPTFCHPRRGALRVPDATEDVARTFARSVGHIYGLEAQTLRTTSVETLYRRNARHVDAVAEAERRGVHFERGDAQLLVVSFEADELSRAYARRELRRGLVRFERERNRRVRGRVGRHG